MNMNRRLHIIWISIMLVLLSQGTWIPPQIILFETIYEFPKQLFCHESNHDIRHVNGRLYTKF